MQCPSSHPNYLASFVAAADMMRHDYQAPLILHAKPAACSNRTNRSRRHNIIWTTATFVRVQALAHSVGVVLGLFGILLETVFLMLTYAWQHPYLPHYNYAVHCRAVIGLSASDLIGRDDRECGWPLNVVTAILHCVLLFRCASSVELRGAPLGA